MFEIQYASPNGQSPRGYVDVYPDTCPICHVGVHPKFVAALSNADVPAQRMDVAFQCSRRDCRSLFIGIYKPTVGDPNHFILLGVAPQTPETYEFGDQIEKLSPMFTKIFNQAMAAEAYQLDQLTGIGLRKALEFLVKDFATRNTKTEEEKEQIKRIPLAQCIKNYISERPVQIAAERAAWLGNDETHYVRKWESQDITDLKQLVKLVVNAVENILLTSHYEQEMPRP